MLEQIYEYLCNKPSDINELLPTIRKYAAQCHTVAELGVRSIVSTYALINENTVRLLSVDIHHPSFYGGNIEQLGTVCDNLGIEFIFLQKSSLEIELDFVDLLFIDTIHTYDQVSKELKLHGDKAKKFIILHDTESCKDELWPAIQSFLLSTDEWYIDLILKNNNGLTVLKRHNVSD